MAAVALPADEIEDWASFHTVCARVLGFPAFYGRNMNAWIDCLTYLDEGDGMSAFTLASDERLVIELRGALGLRERAPELFAALLESVAAVNARYVGRAQPPRVALALI